MSKTKKKEIKSSVEPVKLSRLKRLIASVEQNTLIDVDLSFEFILASLFPRCYYNIQQDLNRQYTLGYIAGKKEAEENLKK